MDRIIQYVSFVSGIFSLNVFKVRVVVGISTLVLITLTFDHQSPVFGEYSSSVS